MRIKTLFIAVLLVVVSFADSSLYAQAAAKTTTAPDPATLSWRKNKKNAKKLLKKGSYYNAVSYLEAGALKKPKKKYFPINLAQADLSLRDYKSSNKWYKVLVDKDSVKHKKPEYIFNYALTLKYLGQYEEAEAAFKKFTKVAGDDDASVELKKRARREADGCRKGIFFRDSVPAPAYKVKHLGENINQPFTDLSPIQRGADLYYGSLISDKVIEVNKKEKLASYSHIYKSVRDGKEWTKGVEISENVNTPNQHIGNPSFSQDGNTMYYTQCTQDDNLKMKCAIYKSSMTNGVWEKGKALGTSVNDPLFSSTQPALGKNKDGEEVLYFASDRNAGKGFDIFYSKVNTDGSLGKARSAGPQINSKGDELSPFFEYKTNTLYFSSNGWINIGGMDVFKTTFDNGGEWTEPENLGMPVNSSVDDIYFSINDRNTYGFMVSNRPGGFGLKSETCCDDIYQVETTKLFLAVKGNVYEEKDSVRTIAENGLVILTDERNGTELNSYNLINGGYFFDLEPKRGYKLSSKKDGFLDTQLSFNTDDNTESDTLSYDLVLKKKDTGNPLFGRIIGKIYYDFDQSRLRADSRDTLRKILDILNQYPGLVLEVGAHTDGKGTEDYNIALSKRRASAATNYFIYEKKQKASRFIPKAFGTSQPAASNTTPDGKDDPKGRALNRRTEFKIVDELKNMEEPAKAVAPIIEKAKAAEKAVVEKKAAEKKVVEKKKAEPVKKEAEVKKEVVNTVATVVEPVKEEVKTSKTKVVTMSEEARRALQAEEDAYKNAPVTEVIVTGKVVEEKAGKKSSVTDGVVFLYSDDAGIQQRTFFIKSDGSFTFDMSRSAAGTYKLIARKDMTESTIATFTLDEVKANNKAFELVFKK